MYLKRGVGVLMGDFLTTDESGRLVRPAVSEGPTRFPNGFFVAGEKHDPTERDDVRIQVTPAGARALVRVAAGVRFGQRLVSVPGSYKKFQAASASFDPSCVIGTVLRLDEDRQVSIDDDVATVSLGIG
ncbi:MAG: hypothetical protein MPI93_01920 [Nitrosopumilus sp.]|nr:hypothetical protein [Nitrosopumilus sp.]